MYSYTFPGNMHETTTYIKSAECFLLRQYASVDKLLQSFKTMEQAAICVRGYAQLLACLEGDVESLELFRDRAVASYDDSDQSIRELDIQIKTFDLIRVDYAANHKP